MGCLSDEDKKRIREVLIRGANLEADEIIEFTEKLSGTCPDGKEDAKAWAERQAKAFADARVELTKKFTDTVRDKMSM